METNSTKIVPLVLASLMLIIIFSETSIGQSCSGSTTIFSDGFGSGGDGTNCFAGSTVTNNTTTNMTMTANPKVNNGSAEPGDGEYSIICDGAGSGFDGFWLWHNTLTDHTAADVNGNMVVINDGDNDDFYKKTLTNLCASKTYTVTFYLANLADVDVGGGCITSLVPNISASAYTVGTTTGSTTVYGTTAMAAQTNLTWVLYTFSFTTAAGQTSMDIVLHDTESAGCGNDLMFDDFKVVGPAGTPSPVTLIDFNADKDGDIVKLNWSTATEVNNDYFLVEKSIDGTHFEPIGTVKGNGTSNEIYYYAFEDNSFNGGIVYYRLKQVDFDNKYEYSKIRSVNVDSADPVTITNDPSSSQAELLISFYRKGEATFTIVDMLGRVVYTGVRVSDEPSIPVNKSMLCCGIYIVKVQIGSELISKKVVLN